MKTFIPRPSLFHAFLMIIINLFTISCHEEKEYNTCTNNSNYDNNSKENTSSIYCYDLKFKSIRIIDLYSSTNSIDSYISSSSSPIVFKHSSIQDWKRIQPSDIHNRVNIQPKYLYGLFKQVSNPYFGPYYDYSRPLANLSSIKRRNDYESNASIHSSHFSDTFPNNEEIIDLKQYDNPPYWSYSTDLSMVDDDFESLFDLGSIFTMTNINETISSINLWLSRYPGITPCHYDGYHNLYIHLYGHKEFYFIHPYNIIEYNHSITKRLSNFISFYPFLHPSYGQCNGNLSNFLHNNLNEKYSIYKVVLEPNDLLYIPPFWIHEVKALNTTVSINMWMNIKESDIMQEIIMLPIPLLSTYKMSSDSLSLLNIHSMVNLPIVQTQLSLSLQRMIFGYGIIINIVCKVYHLITSIYNDELIPQKQHFFESFMSTLNQGLQRRYQHLIMDNELIGFNQSSSFVKESINKLQLLYSSKIEREIDSKETNWFQQIISCHPQYYNDLDSYSHSIAMKMINIWSYSSKRYEKSYKLNEKFICFQSVTLNEIGIMIQGFNSLLDI